MHEGKILKIVPERREKEIKMKKALAGVRRRKEEKEVQMRSRAGRVWK